MSLFKSLRRTYIRKSNRSESPSVQINIKLTHCDWVKDIYSAIQDTPLLMSQKTFVMRMISRIVSGKATQGFELNHPLYTSISQDIENNISSLTSIEITDVLFWLKTMRSFNLPSIGTSAVRKMSYKINELCRNDSLTERQTLAYWFDTIRSGIEPELIAKHMETQLSKTTNYLTNDHYRQIFHCMAACKALANEKLIEISVKKFSDTLEDSYHLKDSIAVVGYLEDIKARTYITSGDNFLRKNIEEIQEKLQKLAELDLYIILEAHDKTACFPKEFIEKVIIKIVKNLKYDLKRLSSTFLIKIGSILNKIEFDTTEALELIRDEVIARFNLGTIEAHTMSQWVLQTHNWKIDLTKVIEFSQSYLPKIRRFNDLIDMSHFCTIFAKQSQLEILKVPVIFI